MSNNPQSSVNPGAGKADHGAVSTNETARAIFETGKLYTGIITSALHADQVYDVEVDGIEQPIQCIWGAGMFSAFLGFKTSWLPTVGTRVAVLGGSPAIIIKTLPNDPPDILSGENAILTGTAEDQSSLKDGENRAGKFHTIPNDLLEGEFEISNTIGVAIRFLTTLIQLKGSERAKVEAHLLDDMVRIVSDTFKHFTCFGDYQIYNDGGLNVRWDGTSREHEAWGNNNPNEPRLDLDNNEVTFDEDLTKSGRWRFTQFIGFCGDFIHEFVTDPGGVLNDIGTKRAGKSRFWRGNDGTMLMQSVTEIAIERVVRIPVPLERKRWDDPEGVLKKNWQQMVDTSKEFTRVWNFGANNKDIHKATYLLRSYARWLSCYHSYARFHQYEQESSEWEIPDESEINHSWKNKEHDVERANPELPDNYDTYACIRIMRDGAILIYDGYGSAITMSRSSVQISSPRHIELDAAGDIRMVAGNDIYLRARRNIELIATVGSFITKARTSWKALCEWGTMWLKSDAVDPNLESAPTPDDVINDPAPEVYDAAILLDTSRGRMTLNSERKLTVQCQGAVPDNATDHTDDSTSVVIQSYFQDVKAHGRRDIQLVSEGANNGYVVIDSIEEILLSSPKILSSAWFVDFNNQITFRANTIHASGGFQGEWVYGNTIIRGPGPEDFVTYVARTGPGYHQHGNHIATIDDPSQEPDPASAEETSALTSWKGISIGYKSPFPTDGNRGPNFVLYQDSTFTYEWSDVFGYGTNESRFEPLSQQRIRTDSTSSFIGNNYAEWLLSQDNLKSAPRTDSLETPYPGNRSSEEYDTDELSDGLHDILSESYNLQTPNKSVLSSRIMKRFFLKTSGK